MQEYIDFFSDNMMMSIIWLLLGGSVIMSFITSASAKYKTIDTSELTLLINNEDGVVIDIRSPDEYKNGHIAGAVNIMPSEIKDGNTASIDKYKNTPVIVVCKMGQTAAGNANILAQAGFEKVYLLKGGISSWNEKNLPTIADKPAGKKAKKLKNQTTS